MDTVNPPGNETAAAELLREYLEASGVHTTLYAKVPERANLVARIAGAGDGPRLALLSHTDTVLADAAEWDRGPWSGDLHDGEVWGRGALDMKGEVAASAVAIASLARDGFEPRGDLVFVAAADEEVNTDYRALVALPRASRGGACRVRAERGRRRVRRPRRPTVLSRLDRREDERAVHRPDAWSKRPRVDSRHRRQRAAQGREARRSHRRVPSGARPHAGDGGVLPRRDGRSAPGRRGGGAGRRAAPLVRALRRGGDGADLLAHDHRGVAASAT